MFCDYLLKMFQMKTFLWYALMSCKYLQQTVFDVSRMLLFNDWITRLNMPKLWVLFTAWTCPLVEPARPR